MTFQKKKQFKWLKQTIIISAACNKYYNSVVYNNILICKYILFNIITVNNIGNPSILTLWSSWKYSLLKFQIR